jgi:hypothetical protein
MYEIRFPGLLDELVGRAFLTLATVAVFQCAFAFYGARHDPSSIGRWTPGAKS